MSGPLLHSLELYINARVGVSNLYVFVLCQVQELLVRAAEAFGGEVGLEGLRGRGEGPAAVPGLRVHPGPGHNARGRAEASLSRYPLATPLRTMMSQMASLSPPRIATSSASPVYSLALMGLRSSHALSWFLWFLGAALPRREARAPHALGQRFGPRPRRRPHRRNRHAHVRTLAPLIDVLV